MTSLNTRKESTGTRRSSKRRSTKEDQTIKEKEEERDDSWLEELINSLIELLRSYGCGDLVGVQIVKSETPFLRPVLPLQIETEEDCARNMLYNYIRKTQNHQEKIRMKLIDVTTTNEIEGLIVSGALVEYLLFKVVMDVAFTLRSLKVLKQMVVYVLLRDAIYPLAEFDRNLFSGLSVKRLVDCSLKAEALAILGKELGNTQITHLYLDRNPIEFQNYHCLLENNLVLRHLSLVQCHIGVQGAKNLGRILGPNAEDIPPHKIRFLNLNNNRLDCRSMKYLAQGLRWNRHLLFLTLAGNKISNVGMEFLCDAMMPRALEKWEKEIKEARLITRTESGRKMLLEELELYKKEMRGEGGYGDAESDSDYFYGRFNFQGLLQEYINNDPNPVSRDVLTVGDKLVSRGNSTLRLLDISYNKIEEEGFECLLNALHHQLNERQTMDEDTREKRHLTGIRMTGNFCKETSRIIQKIHYYLKAMYAVGWVVGEEESKQEISQEEASDAREELYKPKEISLHIEKPVEKEKGPPAPSPPPERFRGRGKHDKQKTRLSKEPEEVVPPDFQKLLTIPSDSESSDLDFGSSSESSETDNRML